MCALLAGGVENSTSYSYPGTKELEVVPLSTPSKAILGRRAPGKEGQDAQELLPRPNCLGPGCPDCFCPILSAGVSRKAPPGGRVTASVTHARGVASSKQLRTTEAGHEYLAEWPPPPPSLLAIILHATFSDFSVF